MWAGMEQGVTDDAVDSGADASVPAFEPDYSQIRLQFIVKQDICFRLLPVFFSFSAMVRPLS